MSTKTEYRVEMLLWGDWAWCGTRGSLEEAIKVRDMFAAEPHRKGFLFRLVETTETVLTASDQPERGNA